jgi:hypothetical protein
VIGKPKPGTAEGAEESGRKPKSKTYAANGDQVAVDIGETKTIRKSSKKNKKLNISTTEGRGRVE